MGTYLVFHMYGPMASFGDTAVGEYRPTFAHPSKSAVVGLIAAAMGIERTEEDRLYQLSEQLGFGVLVLSSGSLLRDYHTTQVPSSVSVKKHPVYTRKDELSIDDQNTILSTRDYRMDAVYRIALWSMSGDVDLNEIKESLKQPGFTLYLGRKSCPPAMPFQPEILKASSAMDALSKTTNKMKDVLADILNAGKGGADGKSDYLLYQDPEPGMEENGLQKNLRKDRLISRRYWQYGDRQEILITVGGADVLQ